MTQSQKIAARSCHPSTRTWNFTRDVIKGERQPSPRLLRVLVIVWKLQESNILQQNVQFRFFSHPALDVVLRGVGKIWKQDRHILALHKCAVLANCYPCSCIFKGDDSNDKAIRCGVSSSRIGYPGPPITSVAIHRSIAEVLLVDRGVTLKNISLSFIPLLV